MIGAAVPRSLRDAADSSAETSAQTRRTANEPCARDRNVGGAISTTETTCFPAHAAYYSRSIDFRGDRRDEHGRGDDRDRRSQVTPAAQYCTRIGKRKVHHSPGR